MQHSDHSSPTTGSARERIGGPVNLGLTAALIFLQTCRAAVLNAARLPTRCCNRRIRSRPGARMIVAGGGDARRLLDLGKRGVGRLDLSRHLAGSTLDRPVDVIRPQVPPLLKQCRFA
jgi:hypothetical protein